MGVEGFVECIGFGVIQVWVLFCYCYYMIDICFVYCVRCVE